MAKRFTSTDIWDEDWFIDLPLDYRLFWFYIKDKCDQAGFFKVNVSSFNSINKSSVSADKAFEFFNKDKQRLRKVNGGLWLIEDFFKFQYGNKLNTQNKMHVGIGKIYTDHGVSLETIKGVERVSTPPKEGKQGDGRLS